MNILNLLKIPFIISLVVFSSLLHAQEVQNPITAIPSFIIQPDSTNTASMDSVEVRNYEQEGFDLYYAIEHQEISQLKKTLASSPHKLEPTLLIECLKKQINIDVARVQLLLYYGSNVNAIDNETHRTALHYAAIYGQYAIAEWLLQEKTEIDRRDGQSSNKTSLHYAALYNHIDLVKLLLEHQAKTDIQDFSGRIPLHYSVENGNKEITQLLISREAKVTISDTNGLSPLDLAVNKHDKDLLKIVCNGHSHKNAHCIKLKHVDPYLKKIKDIF